MIDFKGIKAAVPIEKAAQFLDLKLTRSGEVMRGDCPQCQKPRVLIVTPPKSVFYCHNAKKGGDVSDLVAHVKGITQKQAAQLLQDHFMREPEKPKPVQKRARVNRRKAVQQPIQVEVQPPTRNLNDDYEYRDLL